MGKIISCPMSELNARLLHMIVFKDGSFCQHCGKLFVRTNNAVYCSDKCAGLDERKAEREELSRKRKENMPKATCPICGKIFNLYHKKLTYCSQSCATVHRNKTVKRRKKNG